MQSSIIIKKLDHINPMQDHRWVPDGENQWFLPSFLDLKNNTYSGYWYATQRCIEKQHYHTGIAYSLLLQGEILLKCNNEEYVIK